MRISYQEGNVTVFESELMCTCCTLIEQQDHILLVDPNWLPSEVEYIAQYLEQRQNDRELYLLFTHSDYDHIIGYERFREQAKLIVSESLLQNPQREEQLQEIRKFYDQYYLTAPWPVSYPEAAFLSIKQESEEHWMGQTRYCFMQAPGHNPDGLITYLPDSGILLAGDYLCEVEFPFVYHSIEAYRGTLSRLRMLLEQEEVSLLVAGHGPVSTDQQEMVERCRLADWYLHNLIAYGKVGTPFPEQELWSLYPHFPRIQSEYHQANLRLAQQEYRSL